MATKGPKISDPLKYKKPKKDKSSKDNSSTTLISTNKKIKTDVP